MIKKLKLAEYKNGFRKYLLIAILAFFVANSTVLGFPSPFGVIVTAFLPVNLSSIFIITLFAVRIFLGVDAFSLATLFSALIVYLINLIQSRLSVKKKSFTVILQPFLIYLICSILFLISFSSSLEEYLIALIFSALTFILSLSLSKSNEKKISPYIFIAFITLFSSIDFTYINIGRVFGIYSVFAISYSFGALCACFVGALVLIGVSLYDPSLFETTAFISILTLACANKGITKRLQIPIYSVSTAIVCAVILGYDTNSIGFVIDTLLAASI